MADVIGCQQKAARAICIFASDDPNARGTAKQQPHQQLTAGEAKGRIRVIRFGLGLHRLSVSLSRRHRKAIFQADSFLERDIIVGGSDTRFWL